MKASLIMVGGVYQLKQWGKWIHVVVREQDVTNPKRMLYRVQERVLASAYTGYDQDRDVGPVLTVTAGNLRESAVIGSKR